MTLTLYTENYFDSAHFLENYDGKCSNLHGHTWKIAVWVRGDSSQLDKIGLLWDFTNLKKILDGLDHKILNDVLKKNPTAENITIYVFQKLKSDFENLLFKVRVYEKIIGEGSYCEAGDF